MTKQITISFGDGESAEIMEAILLILREAAAQLDVEAVQLGAELHKIGFAKGYDSQALNAIKRTGILLKTPTNQPIEDNYQDVSLALQSDLELVNSYEELLHGHTATCSFSAKTDDGKIAYAMFESANLAGLIVATIQMLRHIGQTECASRISNALEKTSSTTQEITAENVIENLEFPN